MSYDTTQAHLLDELARIGAILEHHDDGDVDGGGMRHVVEAVQRELDEMIDPTTFGEYREHLRT